MAANSERISSVVSDDRIDVRDRIHYCYAIQSTGDSTDLLLDIESERRRVLSDPNEGIRKGNVDGDAIDALSDVKRSIVGYSIACTAGQYRCFVALFPVGNGNKFDALCFSFKAKMCSADVINKFLSESPEVENFTKKIGISPVKSDFTLIPVGNVEQEVIKRCNEGLSYCKGYDMYEADLSDVLQAAIDLRGRTAKKPQSLSDNSDDLSATQPQQFASEQELAAQTSGMSLGGDTN